MHCCPEITEDELELLDLIDELDELGGTDDLLDELLDETTLLLLETTEDLLLLDGTEDLLLDVEETELVLRDGSIPESKPSLP